MLDENSILLLWYSFKCESDLSLGCENRKKGASEKNSRPFNILSGRGIQTTVLFTQEFLYGNGKTVGYYSLHYSKPLRPSSSCLPSHLSHTVCLGLSRCWRESTFFHVTLMKSEAQLCCLQGNAISRVLQMSIRFLDSFDAQML